MSTASAILIGNVGTDPDMRYLASGTAITKLPLATKRRVKTESGDWENATDWFDITFWGTLAERVNSYVRKGMTLVVFADIETSKSTTEDGATRKYTNFTARSYEIVNFGKKNADEQQTEEQEFDIPF